MEEKERLLYDKYDRLIVRYKYLIERLCLRYSSGDVNRCSELRQDCYISLWRYLPSLRENASSFAEKAWVVLHCRSVFSHLSYRRQDPQFHPINSDFPDITTQDDNSHVRDTLDALAANLTPYERHALSLIAEGYTAEELAQELGIKHRSAVMLRHRIVEKLKQNAKQ